MPFADGNDDADSASQWTSGAGLWRLTPSSRFHMMGATMMRLLTFGGLALESADGSAPRLRPQRLAILAVLAASERGVSRERMYSTFWPDADEERAGHSLRQALYALRQELGEDVVQADATLVLDRARVVS